LNIKPLVLIISGLRLADKWGNEIKKVKGINNLQDNLRRNGRPAAQNNPEVRDSNRYKSVYLSHIEYCGGEVEMRLMELISFGQYHFTLSRPFWPAQT
jgi:hypothetical protein